MAFKERSNFLNSNQESVLPLLNNTKTQESISLSNNLANQEDTHASDSRLAGNNTFLSESSIRDRLRSLPSIQNNSHNMISIQNLTNLYSDVDLNVNTNTGFKQTINSIILVPY